MFCACICVSVCAPAVLLKIRFANVAEPSMATTRFELSTTSRIMSTSGDERNFCFGCAYPVLSSPDTHTHSLKDCLTRRRLRTLRKALYPDEEDDDIIETVTNAIGGSHKHHTKSRATGHSRFLHAGKKVKTIAKMKAAMRPQPKEEEDTDDDEAATKRELKSTRMMRFRKAGAKAKLISKLQTSGALHWASDERAQQLRQQQHHDERSRLDKVESKIDLLLDRIGVKGSKSTDE